MDGSLQDTSQESSGNTALSTSTASFRSSYPYPAKRALVGMALAVSALASAEHGLDLLLNDDLTGARKQLEEQKDSAFSLAGLGICEFLTAAVGLEDDRLSGSMATLGLAEKAAKKSKIGAGIDPGQWWNQPGMEYEVLIADVVAAQAVSQCQN